MSKPERGSLSTLKRTLAVHPPAPQVPALEEQILSADGVRPDVQPASHTDIPLDSKPASLPASLLSRKKRKPEQMITQRIPLSLYRRLTSVANYNGLTMKDILVEALELHLPKFPQPPEDWNK